MSTQEWEPAHAPRAPHRTAPVAFSLPESVCSPIWEPNVFQADAQRVIDGPLLPSPQAVACLAQTCHGFANLVAVDLFWSVKLGSHATPPGSCPKKTTNSPTATHTALLLLVPRLPLLAQVRPLPIVAARLWGVGVGWLGVASHGTTSLGIVVQ